MPKIQGSKTAASKPESNGAGARKAQCAPAPDAARRPRNDGGSAFEWCHRYPPMRPLDRIRVVVDWLQPRVTTASMSFRRRQ